MFRHCLGLPLVTAVLAPLVLGSPRYILVIGGAFAWMGAACLANAVRCGRADCYVLGPAFLLFAIPVLLLGFESVRLGIGE